MICVRMLTIICVLMSFIIFVFLRHDKFFLIKSKNKKKIYRKRGNVFFLREYAEGDDERKED